MTAWLDPALVLLILTNFTLLGSGRLGACIRGGAVQGAIVGLLPLLLVSPTSLTARLAITALCITGLKGLVLPRLLQLALRESRTQREVDPYVGPGLSLLFGLVSVLAAFWLDRRLGLPSYTDTAMLAPVAFMMMMTGLFLIITRRTAVNQVLGYLVLENGIYAFGVVLVRETPALVELGVLMDLFVAVFVMGIAIQHINREFDHIDVDRLNSLTG